MVVMIAFNYLFFLGYAFVIFVWGCSLRRSSKEVEPLTGAVAKQPYINTLTNLRKLKHDVVDEN
jgi:hypothetical protein